MMPRKQCLPDPIVFVYELTKIVEVFTGPADVQGRWGPSAERRK